MSDFSVYQDAERERLATTSQRMMRALHPDANRQARLAQPDWVWKYVACVRKPAQALSSRCIFKDN